MGEKKVKATIHGIKINAVVRWRGLSEKIKSRFNEELAKAILRGGDKDG